MVVTDWEQSIGAEQGESVTLFAFSKDEEIS